MREKVSPPGMQALDDPWQASTSFVPGSGGASRTWKSRIKQGAASR